ncbi:MAG TPA: DUF3303 family protein [Verrucomicrobiae bacterium]|nr:DUF3303 family protein [Verrucomicrobiae bacterium]
MHYIAIAQFPKDAKMLSELASRRRTYRFPAAFANVQSYLDVRGGRAVTHFETDDAKAILRYTADWPEVTFDLFPVVSSDAGWETYMTGRASPAALAT